MDGIFKSTPPLIATGRITIEAIRIMTKKQSEIPTKESNKIHVDEMTEPMQAPETPETYSQFQLTPPPNFATGSIVAELKAEIEMLEDRLANRKAVLEIALKNASVVEQFVAEWRRY